jgi:hypothetical protein
MFHEAETVGFKSGKRSWTGMIELLNSGIAQLGVQPVAVTKETSEVVAYTVPIGSGR